MDTWQYCSIEIKPDDIYPDKRKLDHIYHSKNGDIRETWESGEFNQETINTYIADKDKEGWELMWKEKKENNIIEYFFKRKIED